MKFLLCIYLLPISSCFLGHPLKHGNLVLDPTLGSNTLAAEMGFKPVIL